MKKCFLLLAVILGIVIFCELQAQNPTRPGGGMGGAQLPAIGRFYGKVIDKATGKGVAYASVQLYGMKFDSVARKPQQALLAGQLTEENGDFSLENLPIRPDYTLKIALLGYASYEQKVGFSRPKNQSGMNVGALDKDLGDIVLEISSETLKEVTINAESAQVTLALDKKIYKVDQNGVAAGGTAEDALRNVPSLSVDIDGNVTMRNAAPQIFVDGRPTTLSLDQIPADVIESIEVITNPSAKYDASGGQGGILNIVMKKERRIGYNGSVRGGVDMRGRVNFGGDINAREGKFNAFIGANLFQRRSLIDTRTERTNFGSSNTFILQENDAVNNGLFTGFRAGVDYFINNRNTLTLSGNFNRGGFDSQDDLDIRTDSLLDSGTTSVLSKRITDSERDWQNLGLQLLYKKLFAQEGREWTADVNFNQSKSENDGVFNTTYSASSSEFRQRQQGNGSNRFITAQTDYVFPVTEKIKLEAGARAAIRIFESNNGNYTFNFGNNEYERVPGFADRYKFDDAVYAGYLTYSQQFVRWGYQAGLRAESSYYTGDLPDQDTSFTNDFPLQFFPSVFLSYKINDQDNIQLNYSRRINRPSFFQLLPYPDFSDSLLLSRGNPNLKPEFTNSVELSYQKIFSSGHNILLTAYYKQTENLITRYQFQEFNAMLDRQTIVSTYANSNQSTALGGELTLRNNLWKKLELTTNINAYQSVVDAENVEAGLKVDQFTYLLKENITLRLPKSFTVQVNGEYQSRTAFSTESGGGGRRGGPGGGWGGTTSTAQGYTIPVWSVDVSIRKDLWKRTASITLSMQDIFRTRRQGSHAENTFFVQDTWRLRDPQLVRLNFNYRFGKFDTSLFKRKNTRTEEVDFN